MALDGAAVRTAAHAFLEGLTDLGISFLFANLGTDHVSIIEELARWDAEGRAHPQIILAPHENVAVHMAGGYAMATGEGQAVLVHVDAGTANAAMALHNLFRTRLPVLLLAGRAPYTVHGEMTGTRDTYVHFIQDPFDIASLVRPYVKWEYTLPSGHVAREALRRAHTVMQSDPKGPVYMMLPRETLAQPIDDLSTRRFTGAEYGAVPAGGIPPEIADGIAAELMAAECPIAVSGYVGRSAAGFAALDALARDCGIRVVEANASYVNLPRDSPCFAGFDVTRLLGQADLGLMLDVDVPWIPAAAPQAASLRWLQIDVDAVKRDFPMWGFRTDVRIEAETAIVLGQIRDAVRARTNDSFRARVAARIAGWAEDRAARHARIAAAGAEPGSVDALSPAYVCAALARRLGAHDIVVNEAIRNAPAVMEQIPRTVAGTYFCNGGGGLGFSGGVALGVKLARPDRRVVQIVGDGTFHFCTPDSLYATAQDYGLPILTVVLDNRGWSAVKAAVLRVYPDGAAVAADSFHSRLDGRRQGMQRSFEDVARAFGGYGELVRDPAELDAAIDRCLAAVDGGQAAVLNVRVAPL